MILGHRRVSGGSCMGLFDEFNKALKKVEDEINKAEIDKKINEVETDIKKEFTEKPPAASQTGQATAPAPAPALPHTGYARITAWVKERYRGKIKPTTDTYHKNLEMEMIATEACAGLSPKAKKGFLNYLKKQNYEQLLK
jgi:hypothetical protein